MRRREAIALVIILTIIVTFAYQVFFKAPRLKPQYSYQVVNKYPHDPCAFTQGLFYNDGFFYEGTGLHGESSLRIVAPETGEIIKKIDLAPEYFGEGVAMLNDYIYQLSWREHKGFVYDLALNLVSTWTIPGEGWGLTENGTHLIMSDGTSKLSYFNPEILTIVKIITITSEGEEITRINELEYIGGYIYANIWQTDKIAIIDPATGIVASWIDLTGLENELDSKTGIDVLNGIAHDKETEKIYVTGKFWPNLFEIKLIPK